MSMPMTDLWILQRFLCGSSVTWEMAENIVLHIQGHIEVFLHRCWSFKTVYA